MPKLLNLMHYYVEKQVFSWHAKNSSIWCINTWKSRFSLEATENKVYSFLRRTLFSCPQNVKEAAYKGMVRPILEYGSSVLDPHLDKLQEEMEKVQNRAARFVTRNYVYETGSMTGILGQLKWESLKKRRKDNRLILLYTKVWKVKPGYLQMTLFPRVGMTGISTPLPFRYPQPVKMSISIASFPRLSGTWMTSLNPWFLPLNCKMLAYLSSPLLWELGTNFPQSQPLVRDSQFGVSPVNYSISDTVNALLPGKACFLMTQPKTKCIFDAL